MSEDNFQPNNRENLKTIRTYLSDMADTVRENDISVIKIALAEQNKHEREDLYKQIGSSNSKKTFWFIIGGIIFMALAIFGIYYLNQIKSKNNLPQIIEKEESIISYDERKDVNVSAQDDLTSKISETLTEKSSLNKNSIIKYISLTKESNGVKENLLTKNIFPLLSLTAPSSLVRSFSDLYMIGTYIKNTNAGVETVDGKPSLFIIFQTNDYSLTYAGMLEWEKILASDMLLLFNLNTKESRRQIGERQWKDVIINNKDARVLFNEDGLPILYYLFIDKGNLIITDNQESIKEIADRLIIKNIKPL